MPKDQLLEAVIDLLESGDTEGCDGLIVCGLQEYAKVQAVVKEITGHVHGEHLEQ